MARKLTVRAWQLLTRGEDYAFQRPSVVRRKLRALELKAGAPPAESSPNVNAVWDTTGDAAEKRLAEQAEAAYRRLIADWHASGPKAGAGATPERASERQPAESRTDGHGNRHRRHAATVARLRDETVPPRGARARPERRRQRPASARR